MVTIVMATVVGTQGLWEAAAATKLKSLEPQALNLQE